LKVSQEQVLMLKLQMGIDPSARIEPNILRLMWRQLEIEAAKAKRRHSQPAINQVL
jgi:hypothetical protein